jgi:hypothetical protein
VRKLAKLALSFANADALVQPFSGSRVVISVGRQSLRVSREERGRLAELE